MNKRIWLGLLIAPLIAPILYQLGLIIFEYDSVPNVSALIAKSFLPLLVVALPISYGALLLVGLPIIWILKRNNFLSFYSVTFCAALVGALIMTAVYGPISLKNDGWYIYFWYPIFGGVLGYSVAAVYCLISGTTFSSNYE